MAGSGHNHQQIKYSYFHYNNSPVLINKTPSVCTSTHLDQSMMNSSTSPWYHPSAISGENDDSKSCDGPNAPPVPLATMNKPPSSLSLNTDCTNTNQQPYENYGHFFVKKTFHKPTYCHHCVEMLWGLIGQGYYCEVCNFICHDRCRKYVISPCSSIAPILIKNPVCHIWSDISRFKRKFCNICRKRLEDFSAVRCEVCEYYAHEDCKDFAVNDCRETATYVPTKDNSITSVRHYHHWREGNLPTNSKCAVCRKTCWSSECLAGMRCEWCGITTHSTCRSRVPEECGFGTLRDIIIPPSAISIPRIADLNKDLILGIGNNMSKPIQTASNNNSIQQPSDYVIVSPSNIHGSKSPGTFMRTSSTDNPPSGGDPDTGPIFTEKDPQSRSGVDMHQGTSAQIENVPPTTTKLKSSKPANKGQQDEEEEREMIKVYDGNATYRNGTPRSISVPKQASYTQILEAALRTFHINDDCTKYCITVPTDDGGNDQPLDETMPLKSLKQLSGRTLNIYIRYKERGDMDIDYIRVYPGILKTHDGFKSIRITSANTTLEVIAKALTDFGLHNVSAEKYSLVEVLLISNVNYTDRILEPNEYPLQVLRTQRKESVRSHRVTRFYLQHKEDPHGPSVSLFVGNLPPGPRTEKQYEKILFQDIFKSDKDLKWDNMDVIYYEHGAMVLVYNDSDRATKAFTKLRQAKHDQKQLLVLMLPNIQPEFIPSHVTPLLVFVNVKSGGQQGAELITNFRHLLNPHQVFDLQNGGPLPGLYVFRNIPHYRILACGGDGTVGWVLSCLDNVGQDALCQSPPVGIVPLGTGNDLARVLRWGSGYAGGEEPLALLRDIVDAEEIKLDRWTVVFHQDQDKRAPAVSDSNPAKPTTTKPPQTHKVPKKPILNPAPPPSVSLPIAIQEGTTNEDKTEMFVMNNYFGLGLDADICLDFHMAREENPNKFNSRIQAKGYYLKTGIRKMMKKGGLKDFTRDIVLEVDGRRVELPQLEGIVIMNILSWASGANLWGHEKDEKFSKPTHYDGMLEVVGVTGIVHLGQIQSGIRSGVRLAQGGHIHIRMNNDYPVPVQVDGEPWLQPPCDITIIRSALKATMLRKRKSKIKRRNTEPSVYFPDVDDDSKC
ncbi:unnamed protein product [Adineta steineri]|uniref:Diacylglycerol kinase n=1 Tax=Adineta steineri TaxID=433720 RepID=A0A818SD16_9BILA|nr:unnamed protein product [Adineta steineri]CAF0763292.1 unnamed protein product [Adineta steineri]CAF3523367.1 unnamed protein product [Adineta steineri]CAF3526152.1 unnamed protein product [Adineta steineri]CAF3661689.1 unnamed protein product [Adineta steineri]